MLFAAGTCAAAQPSDVPTQTPPATASVPEAPPATASVSETPPADQISPLPPPATRAGLRGRWFEFLSALHDDDFPATRVALTDILKTADRVGISRLSDFSRAALQEARLAQRLAKRERAAVAYDAAIRLDPDLPDARWEQARFSWTGGRKSRALLEEMEGVTALLSSRESRRELFSNAVILLGISWGAALAGLVISLFVRHIRRISHDLQESAEKIFGGRGALPLGVAFLGLPLWLSFGPLWLLLYWAAILFAYSERRERIWLALALVTSSLAAPAFEKIADSNIIARSPLVSAAVELEEKKEEGGSVDLLRRASQVFPEDPDVWYLLGRFAQRREDYEEAAANYARALKADPHNFRCMIALGNIRFWQGDLAQASQDYRDALGMRPNSALANFNLSLAQGDSYLFDQQKESLANARRFSPHEVDRWIESPTLGRVISLEYTVPEAEDRTRQWGRNSKSQVLPGIHQPPSFWEMIASPLCLGPWVVLLAGFLLYHLVRSLGVGASECARCGKPFCPRCKAKDAPALYCQECVRIYFSKQGPDIARQVASSEEAKRSQRLRRRERRILSLFLPGARRITDGQAGSGFLVLFIFFLLVAVSFLTASLFPVRSIPVSPAFPLRAAAAGSLAFLIWLVSNVRTLRS
jgi:tetratricopeptide (TPR) repeat protein